MKEWNNPYNSFNSLKGLLYLDWYKSIKDWKEGHRLAPLPPVEASLDPIHACNLLCEHCNAHKYLAEGNNGSMLRMSDEHIINLVRFLGKWGVKSVCFGGGGEPTLHTELSEALLEAKKCGMESSIATNGTLINDELLKVIPKTCRWVGVSIDAATSKTYKIGRKKDLFKVAISNLRKLVKACKNSDCDIAFKFLIFNYNQNEIYEACKLAKEIGVKDFHARPADYSHQGMGELANKIGGYDIELVKQQCEKCHELEDKDFHVYTIYHKFDTNFKPLKNFSQCYASPCCIQLCADGGVYLCPDQRFQEFYKIGNHYPDPLKIGEAWGSNKHYELVFNKGKDNCNTRCTFAPYCKQCEDLVIEDKDPFCWKFI
jgi:MoaA/NifB/PqqE/SkfB family radical SAM enzyme